MKIAFTGTRFGMTEAQKTTVASLLWISSQCYGEIEAHHGDCVGADKDFHDLVRANCPGARIIGHPGPEANMRANCQFDEERTPKTHFARNRDLVNETEVLIGTPYLPTEQAHGGTWYTIKYSRKTKPRSNLVVWPDGTYAVT